MQHRLPRVLGTALAAAVPVLGLMAAFGPVANASTAPTHLSQKAQALAIARQELKHLDVGWHATEHPSGVHHASVTGGAVSSSNWAGYADINETFSDVGGSWTEPSVTCTSTTALAAFWVGIDGFSSSSVEQDGTLAECYGGALYQFSWWEMYPTNAIQVVGESVAAGDHIAASVVRSGTSYALRVTDSTHTANSFSTTQTCSSCANSSAEWIAEAPSGSGGIYPLPNFHTWTLTSGTASTPTSSGNISSYPYDSITMVGASDTKASVSGLSGGNSFTVTWQHST